MAINNKKDALILDGGASGGYSAKTTTSGTGTTSQSSSTQKTTTQSNNAGYTYTPSASVSNAQSIAAAQRDKVLNLADPMASIDSGLWNRMITPYSISPEVQAAIDKTNSLLAQLESGRTSYTDQISSLIDQIMNRDAFSYNPDDDMLFQTALASAMDSGKIAMQDTMGQAAALTGGYGSTYATAAANGAYNQYIQDAYAQLPEYYQMAMEAYNLEGDQMLSNLGVLTDADAREYERMYNAWSANYQTAADMYSRDFNEWSADVAQAQNAVGIQYDAAVQRNNQQISAFNAAQEYAESLYAQEYGQWQDEVSLLMEQQEAEYEYTQAMEELANEQAQWEAEYSADMRKGITPEILQEALEIYENEGPEALAEFADLNPSLDGDYIYSYATTYGTAPNSATYTKSEDASSMHFGYDLFTGVNLNSTVTDQYGQTYTLRQLKNLGVPNEILKELNELAVGEGSDYYWKK